MNQNGSDLKELVWKWLYWVREDEIAKLGLEKIELEWVVFERHDLEGLRWKELNGKKICLIENVSISM